MDAPLPLLTAAVWASVLGCGPLLLGLVATRRPTVRRALRAMFLTACVGIAGYLAMAVTVSRGSTHQLAD